MAVGARYRKNPNKGDWLRLADSVSSGCLWKDWWELTRGKGGKGHSRPRKQRGQRHGVFGEGQCIWYSCSVKAKAVNCGDWHWRCGVNHIMECVMRWAKELRVDTIGIGEPWKDLTKGNNLVNWHFIKFYLMVVWQVSVKTEWGWLGSFGIYHIMSEGPEDGEVELDVTEI